MSKSHLKMFGRSCWWGCRPAAWWLVLPEGRAPLQPREAREGGGSGVRGLPREGGGVGEGGDAGLPQEVHALPRGAGREEARPEAREPGGDPPTWTTVTALSPEVEVLAQDALGQGSRLRHVHKGIEGERRIDETMRIPDEDCQACTRSRASRTRGETCHKS